MEVWPAVELSCDVEAGEVHMLGYFVDHRLDWFQALLVRLRDGRADRAERMVEQLAALGVPIELRPGPRRWPTGAPSDGRTLRGRW